MKTLTIVVISLISCLPIQAAEGEVLETDVCIYGGTASGVTAGLAAARRGKSVIIVEPFRHMGGMHGGGIRIQKDCRYLEDIGGIARALHDADRAVPGGGDFGQWQARLMMKEMVEDAGIRFFTEHRLDGRDEVVKEGAAIQMIHLNYAPIMAEGVPAPEPAQRKALSVKAKVFIDASYEGDLMAFSGCDYTVGRESRDVYAEILAGQTELRYFDVDPYVIPGDPSSGLLPMISTEPYKPGAASRYNMAYNFRLRGIRDREHKDEEGMPIKPLGKAIDRERYELVTRGLEQDETIGWPIWNYGRNRMVSSGPPGRQADYPDGDWAERSAVWRDWIDHVKTMNILCGIEDPVLPEGLYPENDDFPDQLYIRLGRRMIGEYVVTQHDLMHQTVINDSIGLGYYGVDLYPARLIAHQGKVASEGQLFVCVSPGPYQIPYRALIPKEDKVDNLIVSVCMSASHVAMSSIRMESTYVVMGEAAGVAACHAVESGECVQEVDVKALCADLTAAGVVTEWNGKGYGPNHKKPWSVNTVHWESHPEDYQKIPIRLDTSWENYRPTAGGSGGVRVEAFSSVEEWNRKKPNHKWLFPYIDKNGDGRITVDEHQAFQKYKRENKNWFDTLKPKGVQTGSAEPTSRKQTGAEEKILKKPAGTQGPNIIVIMTDDMGYSDLGCFGSEIETPHLDSLAGQGLRFTQFYNTAKCCPTRASLLTGLYAHQAGLGGMIGDAGPENPGYRGRLMERCVTIAEVLGPAGYHTIHTGKWHVGQDNGGCATGGKTGKNSGKGACGTADSFAYYGECWANVSNKPCLTGPSLQRNAPLFFEHKGNRGVRQGQWKLVSLRDGDWELYDMQSDRTELNDLSTQFPDIVLIYADDLDADEVNCTADAIDTWPTPSGAQRVLGKAQKAGVPKVYTPHIDSLAKRGVLFTHF